MPLKNEYKHRFDVFHRAIRTVRGMCSSTMAMWATTIRTVTIMFVVLE